jgi:molecular chaperone GrpE
MTIWPMPIPEDLIPSGTDDEVSDEESSPIVDIEATEQMDVDADIASALEAIEKVHLHDVVDEDEIEVEFDVENGADGTEPASVSLSDPPVTPVEPGVPSEKETAEIPSRESTTAKRTVDAAKLQKANAVIQNLQTRLSQMNKAGLKLKSNLEESLKNNKELHERWVRVSADYQNYQKRTRSKLGEFVEAEQMTVIRSFLPIFENFKRALASSEEESTFHEGIRLIYKQIEELLVSWKVREIPALNENFDPFIHEAMDRIIAETDEMNNKVVTVYETGYYFKDKVLRPARVVVAMAIDQLTSESESADESSPTDSEPAESQGEKPDETEADESVEESTGELVEEADSNSENQVEMSQAEKNPDAADSNERKKLDIDEESDIISQR